jgi:hypothetical protein
VHQNARLRTALEDRANVKAALMQGRLAEDEYDERMAQASASRSRAELAVLTADLPVSRMDAPRRRSCRTGGPGVATRTRPLPQLALAGWPAEG